MIRNTKQNWAVGQTVKVGFLAFTVKAAVQTPGDGAPDVYFLTNRAGDKLYEFIPHHGLRQVSLEEAKAKIGDLHQRIARIAASQSAQTEKQAACRVTITGIFFDAQARDEARCALQAAL
jgi:hypothetical protein